MKVLVIGLGSMGKRRIRCLQKLGIKDIFGYDTRADRVKEAVNLYKIDELFEISALESLGFDLIIISTPPDQHKLYMLLSVSIRTPFFVEASVISEGLQEISDELLTLGLKCYPSTTLRYHPAICEIRRLLAAGIVGKVLHTTLHSGQYLPDWHSYEHVSDFYVSNKETGGGREIVPFELTWFVEIFGMPNTVTGMFRKTRNIDGASDIDDVYVFLMDYGSQLSTFSVDVVSRVGTRLLLINGELGQIRWSWEENYVRFYSPENNTWQKISFEVEDSADLYNKNITESMYVDEIKAVIDDLSGSSDFPNCLENDINILKLLEAVEISFEQRTMVKI